MIIREAIAYVCVCKDSLDLQAPNLPSCACVKHYSKILLLLPVGGARGWGTGWTVAPKRALMSPLSIA
jgi:hypothetical protein